MNPPLKIVVYKIVKIHLTYPLLPLSSLKGGGGRLETLHVFYKKNIICLK